MGRKEWDVVTRSNFEIVLISRFTAQRLVAHQVRCTCPTECTAIGRLAGLEGTDVYCHRKCLRYPSECPKEECECVEKIDPSDPINVLDQSSNNFKYISEFKNKNGHAVEEFQEVDGEKYKIISVY